MAPQATIIDGIAGIFESESALLIAIVAAAALYLWVDPQLPFSETGVPWRQLLQNRSINGIVLSSRTFCSALAYRFLR